MRVIKLLSLFAIGLIFSFYLATKTFAVTGGEVHTCGINLGPVSENISGNTYSINIPLYNGNSNTVIASVYEETNMCSGIQENGCFDNTVGVNKTYTLNPGQTININLTRTNPSGECGSFQHDIFLTSVNGNTGCVSPPRYAVFGFWKYGQFCPTVTSTPTPTPTSTPTSTPTPTLTPTPTVTPTPTPTPGPQSPSCDSLSASPANTGTAPLSVNFFALAHDPNGYISQYKFDFGDGTVYVSSGNLASHTYGQAGNYTAVLTVTDNQGLTATSDSCRITISPNTPSVTPPKEQPKSGTETGLTFGLILSLLGGILLRKQNLLKIQLSNWG